MTKRRYNAVLARNVAERLRQLRKERKISQQNVLADTEVHISRIENQWGNISLTTLSDLCDYYGVSLSEFFRGVKSH